MSSMSIPAICPQKRTLYFKSQARTVWAAWATMPATSTQHNTLLPSKQARTLQVSSKVWGFAVSTTDGVVERRCGEQQRIHFYFYFFHVELEPTKYPGVRCCYTSKYAVGGSPIRSIIHLCAKRDKVYGVSYREGVFYISALYSFNTPKARCIISGQGETW